MSEETGVVVVGAGPAGLTAAGEAASAGVEVILLEGRKQAGEKLLLTGKKRCNLSNTLPLHEFLEGYGPNGRFLRNAFSRFFREELVAFLDRLGVATARERGGRVYPVSGGADGVRKALVSHLGSSGARMMNECRVSTLKRGKDGRFAVQGEDFSVRSSAVILTTGGASFPWTGSRGDGFRLAERLGHTIVPLTPALVPVRCSEKFLPRLAGLRLRNVSLRPLFPRRKKVDFFGEVHFTDFGISGPAVFPASREIGLAAAKAPLSLELNLKPALSPDLLDGRLQRELGMRGRRLLSEVLETLLPIKIIPVFLECASADGRQPSDKVTGPMRRKIVALMQAFPLTATGTLPLERAMVTSGGVALKEVNPATMESLLVPGLFFGGEILDLDGSTGGFNLQAAFSTGALSGRSAAAALGESDEE